MISKPEGDPPVPKEEQGEATSVGNYFVSNYPPFSFWRTEDVSSVHELLDTPPMDGVPFGLYVHIPFCRRRCDFCYFRVYTGREARSVELYLEAVVEELTFYAAKPRIRGRRPEFVYFGGGTPSYLTTPQLRELFLGLQQRLPWDGVGEVTFECEPGTLDDEKIGVLRDLGVTRLSLGVENFDPEILAANNRAHRAKEIDVAYAAARRVGFPQINVDLIAGMVGETDANWQRCIENVRTMAPESVTIYQMEIPYNTTVFERMRESGEKVAPVAGWATKRRWVDEAFRGLEADGYHVGSAYTAMKDDGVRFLYRDGLWHGADLLGLGVASFSHVGGVHFQNEHHLDPYVERVKDGELPLHRALVLSQDERLIREFVLQLKLGRVPTAPFREKFQVDVLRRFAEPLAKLQAAGHLHVSDKAITVERASLLQIDPLLESFFLAQHRNARYA